MFSHSLRDQKGFMLARNAAISLALLYQRRSTWSLASLMAVVIIFNFVMSTWRAPVVALMPDITPPSLRSKANGVINLMGGLGSLFYLFSNLFKNIFVRSH
jgi:MFS family permease